MSRLSSTIPSDSPNIRRMQLIVGLCHQTCVQAIRNTSKPHNKLCPNETFRKANLLFVCLELICFLLALKVAANFNLIKTAETN
jgi:hypothetical protein